MNYRIYIRLDPMQLIKPDFAMPSLQRLLAAGAVTADDAPFEAALCQALGIGKQHDWPAAALSWLGEGHDPGGFYWMYADPVHFSLQRDHFSLALPAPLSLSELESRPLLDALNRHFYEQGLHFSVGATGRWYMRVEDPVAITTSSISQAAGRDVGDFMPQGEDAEKWRKLLNEMQMLLHGQTVNQLREEQGLPVVNSLWLSGGGVLPDKAQAAPQVLFANDTLTRGAAMQASVKSFGLDDNFASQMDRLAALGESDENIMCVLENDASVEQAWFAPLLTALKGRKIRQLTMDVFVQDRHVRAELKPMDIWKFWRKPRQLAAYFSW